MAENSKTFNRLLKDETVSPNENEISQNLNLDEHEVTVSQALSAENTLKSNWYILTPHGNLTKYEDYRFQQDRKEFGKFI